MTEDHGLGIALAILAFVIAVILHELAHGYVARALGDSTASQAGRLSLNPLSHIDRFGSVLLPLMLYIGQMLTLGRVDFMFGWAKPVPVDPSRFRYPRQGMAIVAVAGPATNFALALLGAFGLATFDAHGLSGAFFVDFIQFNLLLGLFNLLPLPPLDGGRIVAGILPARLALYYAQIERAGILTILAVVLVLPWALSQIGIHFDPVGAVLNRLVPGIGNIMLRLAGAHVRF